MSPLSPDPRRVLRLVPALLLLVAGCAHGSGAGKAPPDSLQATRVVSLAPSVTEIIYALGGEGGLLAVTAQCDYPLAAKLKPRVGNFGTPDVSAIIGLRPDLVLAAEYVRPECERALREAGVRLEIVQAATVDQVVTAVRRVGELLGRSGEAGGVSGTMERRLAAVEERLRSLPAKGLPRVYVEVDGPAQLYTVGGPSFMSDLVARAGGVNVFAGRADAYLATTQEEVAGLDPQVVFIDHPFQYKAGVAKRPGWERISAVRDGRVFDSTDFDIILMNRPGPRIVQSVEEIARLLHPELFK